MANKKQGIEANLPATQPAGDFVQTFAHFDDYMRLPDDIDALGERMQWLLAQDARSHFMKGVILAKVQQICRGNGQTFAHFVTEYCGGMSVRAVHNYIRFARQCAELETIREFAESNWSKVITLMNSFSPDELEDIDEKGIGGKPLIEYEYVSAREFQQIINDYKAQLKNADAQAHKKYKDQIDSAEKRIKELEMQLPKPDDDSWAIKSLGRIHQQLDYFMNELNAFAFNPLVIGNGNIKAKVEGLYQAGYRAFIEFIHKWENYTGHQIK